MLCFGFGRVPSYTSLTSTSPNPNSFGEDKLLGDNCRFVPILKMCFSYCIITTLHFISNFVQLSRCCAAHIKKATPGNFVVGEVEARKVCVGTRSKPKRSIRRNLVGSSGLEPPTSRLSGARSNHLSYEPIA